MSVTDDVASPSSPPPGWTPVEGGLFVPPPGAPPTPGVAPAPAPGVPPAPGVAPTPGPTPAPEPITSAPALHATEAAVRWRLRAARIDNLIVYAGYLGLCVAERWNPALPDHLLLLAALGILYHFVWEARDGQTPGKRRSGIRVVALDGRPASPRAVAVRSVLRAIDGLPILYASGLVSMLRTGPARRQRIGDVAAGTKVVAVDGRAARRGTPGWYLPLATLVAVIASVFTTVAAIHAHSAPMSSDERAALVRACETTGTPGGCECIFRQLAAEGYSSFDQVLMVLRQTAVARAEGRPDLAPAALLHARALCAPGPGSGAAGVT